MQSAKDFGRAGVGRVFSLASQLGAEEIAVDHAIASENNDLRRLLLEDSQQVPLAAS
jgi:hypothetical protein